MVSRRRADAAVLLVLAVAASSFVAVALSRDEAAGPDYGYAPGTKLGPENWAKLSPKYAACNGGSPGSKQSPIDIVTGKAVPKADLESLERVYAAVNATLINDGKDLSMTFAGKVGTVAIGGKVFSLKKLEWHSPSEHIIDGKSYPLELHLVHKSDAGEIAILAILYKVGGTDAFHIQLRKRLPELASDKCNYAEEDGRAAVAVMHMRSLEKRTGNYFRYVGSLTAPPCTENVYWNVLGKVRQISKQQLDLLASPLPASAKPNARPVQPLNGRVVTFYDPPNTTISFPF